LTEVSSIALQAICSANLPRGDEDQPFQMAGHEGLASGDPDVAQVGHILALLLKRLQVFFV
jgi:CO dehydrogenase/acetyl-CoA synthase alpha subunit